MESENHQRCRIDRTALISTKNNHPAGAPVLYNTLKFLHILLTIIAVGFTMTFGIILSRAEKGDKDGRELKYARQTVRFMSRIANIGFVLIVHGWRGLVQRPGASPGRRCGFTDRRGSS